MAAKRRRGRKRIRRWDVRGPSLQVVEAEEGGAEGAGQLDDFEIADPAGAGFDPGDGEPVDVPALALTPGRKLLL